MLHLVALVTGAGLVVFVFLDALATTLSVGAGGGPLTRRLAAVLWRGLLRVHRRDSEFSLLTVAGAVLMLTTVLVWVATLWTGWTLVLVGVDASIVQVSTGAPAGPADVAYYAGFTVFTLGVGDFVASTATGRLVTALASFSGLFLITLAITHLISVVSAVVTRCAIAIHINALGDTASDIIARGWTGDAFSSAFVQQLVALTGELAATAEQHLAYPVLHYFHTGHRSTSASIAIARLDDAMLLLTAAVAPLARPDASAVDPVRRAIDRYLTTVLATSATPHQGDPPLAPDLDPLIGAGIPVVDAATFTRSVEAQSQRRSTLRRLVEGEGWSWQFH